MGCLGPGRESPPQDPGAMPAGKGFSLKHRVALMCGAQGHERQEPFEGRVQVNTSSCLLRAGTSRPRTQNRLCCLLQSA